jgi:hypothetical protein
MYVLEKYPASAALFQRLTTAKKPLLILGPRLRPRAEVPEV